MLRFRSLASGSSGNATLIEGSDGLHRTRVLVDCGLGLRQLIARLAVEGIGPADLDGIFITHEHGDHIGCAPMLVARYGVPLWTSAGTAQYAAFAGLESARNLVRDGQVFAIGGLQLHPFTVPHDAREPLQLRCTDGDRVLGLMTDIGHVTGHALAALAGCHALVLESNHDPDLLAASGYPAFLQRRISGNLGHLANDAAAGIAQQLRHPGLRQVVAAHLSRQNNRPDLAQAALAQALGCSAQDIAVAHPQDGTDWITA